MAVAKKDDWVEIENTVLKPEQRATHLPEDTKAVPLKMWVRGFLVNDEGELGDEVSIRTLTDRVTSGTLVDLNPRHVHDFGDTVQALIEVGRDVRKELESL